MCVSVACRVERVLEPRPSRNSLRIAPIALHLHEVLIHSKSICAVQTPARDCSDLALIEFAPGLLKFGDVSLQGSKINMSGDVAPIVLVGDQTVGFLSVKLEVERQNFGVS